MDNSPLNEAHRQHRKAEASMRLRKYDDAIQCHERAANLLQEALSMTESIKATESLRLQCQYHLKQIDLVNSKREQFEKYKRSLEKQKLKMAKPNFDSSKDNSLQIAINKTMDEADSLVDILFKRNNKSITNSIEGHDSLEGEVVKCHNIGDNLLVSGLKEPKNDNVVIEELQILNQQLRKFVFQLMNQLEASTQEAKTLKNRVSYLESERNKLLGLHNSPQSSPRVVPHTPLAVITDSAEGNSSPFVFSPCSELSPEATDEVRELPPLPPLEMPDFDFDSIISQIKIKSEESTELTDSQNGTIGG